MNVSAREVLFYSICGKHTNDKDTVEVSFANAFEYS